MGLTVAAKADSQDICFVPQGKYSDIIAKLKPNAASPGDIVHIDGRVLGRHDGILRFTIGQRRGIGIASGEPLYVVHIDAERARVVVGPREALETHKIYLRSSTGWATARSTTFRADGLELFAKVRSTRPPRPADALSSRRPDLGRARRRRIRHRARPGLRALFRRRQRGARATAAASSRAPSAAPRPRRC